MSVHSLLPEALTAAVAEVLDAAAVRHVAHGTGEPVRAAAEAAADTDSLAVIGPFRSADVAEALEVTAVEGLPLLAPVATWAGVTRDDEPGCDDAARHLGTVLRLVARDTVVAARLAHALEGRRALVVAGDHEYGVQLDGQLRLGGLDRAEDPGEADLVVLAGLEGHPEIARAAELAPLPLIAFDGVQGSELGAGRELSMALPFTPGEDFSGTDHARRAAELVVAALDDGAADRAAMLAALRARGGFDEHGDPPDPPVWLWRVGPEWSLEPERSL